MRIVPGFKFQFCFEGWRSAWRQSWEKKIIVLFWRDGKKFAVISAFDGVVEFPCDDRQEIFEFYQLLGMNNAS